MITLEFDEASFHGHYDEMQVATQKFTKAGIKICISHYGSFNSSLMLLSDFEFQYLKIAPELINSEYAKDILVLENLISMAQKLGYEVVCTDPDSTDVAENACRYGCSYFVGDIFDKPLSERFFKKHLK